jgi:DNA-binding NarL/FixJ family response regulator
VGTQGKARRVRVLLADDHAGIVEQAREILEHDYEIVGAVNDGAALVETAQRVQPDVIVSDIRMPQMTGFEAAAKLREMQIPAKIIFMTVHSTTPYVKRARALGADGYVLKIHIHEQLLPAVNAVVSGESYLSPELPRSGWV